MMYEFKCNDCDYEFTHVSTVEDRNIPLSKPCPECGKDAVKRIYSVSNRIDSELLKADKRMEASGVQQALERIRDHSGKKMNWKG